MVNEKNYGRFNNNNYIADFNGTVFFVEWIRLEKIQSAGEEMGSLSSI